MLKCYNKLGGNNPVSFGGNRTKWKIEGRSINSHYGAGSIVKYKYFKKRINEIYKYTTEERINKGIKCYDDVLYTYAAMVNGYKYLLCNDYSIKPYVKNSPSLNNPFTENYNKNYKILSRQYHKIIRFYISNKYNITIKQLIDKLNK